VIGFGGAQALDHSTSLAPGLAQINRLLSGGAQPPAVTTSPSTGSTSPAPAAAGAGSTNPAPANPAAGRGRGPAGAQSGQGQGQGQGTTGQSGQGQAGQGQGQGQGQGTTGQSGQGQGQGFGRGQGRGQSGQGQGTTGQAGQGQGTTGQSGQGVGTTGQAGQGQGRGQGQSGQSGQTQGQAPVAAGQPASSQDQAAIQQAIQGIDDAQAKAVSSNDLSGLSANATSDFAQQQQSVTQDLLTNGVSDIKLVNIEWGPITVNGTTATATAYETWSTTYSDSSVEQARDRNVYTLVQQNGNWVVQADDHPDADASAPTGLQGMPGIPDNLLPPGFPNPFQNQPGTGNPRPQVQVQPGTTNPNPQVQVQP
jgi:hypothetical protein